MKSLVQYIEESLKAEEMFITAIKDNKFTKEQIVNMLTNMDIKDIKKISDKFKQDYEDDYFAYEPSKDDFLKNLPTLVIYSSGLSSIWVGTS